MTNMLILGAYGQIARIATKMFLEKTNFNLTLYLRNSSRLANLSDERHVKIIEGDVLDIETLESAMHGQDVVYANLNGNMKAQAKCIINAMHKTGVKRLIFISSMGIYGEVPGETYRSVLDSYRDSALLIEASNLDYTIMRPEWLNNNNELNYGTTQKGEPFKNAKATVSRKSIADLIVKLSTGEKNEIRKSLGVHSL